MPTRKRILNRSSGAAGGVSPIIAVVEWGPDFGESSDNNTWTVGVHLTMPELALENSKTVGVNLTMPSLALENNKTVGVHLSGEVLGAPFWQSVQTAAHSSAGSDITITKPASTVSGDLLVAFIGISAAVGSPDINTLSGWTLIRTDNVSGVQNNRVRSFYRISDGTEGSSFTFTFTASADQATGEIHRLVGTHATTPINASAGRTILSTDLEPDPVIPAVTTTATNCMVFAFLFHYHAALPQTHTPPASHDERTDFESTVTTLICGSTNSTRAFAAAASTGTATVNCTETVGTEAIMQRVAIAPGTYVIAA